MTSPHPENTRGGVGRPPSPPLSYRKDRRSLYLQVFLPVLPLQLLEQHWLLVVQDAPCGEQDGQSVSVEEVQPAGQHPSPELHAVIGVFVHDPELHASVVHALLSLQSALLTHPRVLQICAQIRSMGTPRFGQFAQWCRAITLWEDVARTGDPDDPPSVSHW